MVRSGRGPFGPAQARRARAQCIIFFENLRNPARGQRAGAMRQFPTAQLDSTNFSTKFSKYLGATLLVVHARLMPLCSTKFSILNLVLFLVLVY